MKPEDFRDLIASALTACIVSLAWYGYFVHYEIPTAKYLNSMIENCELYLPRNQHCEIQITAVPVEVEYEEDYIELEDQEETSEDK